MLGKKQVEHVLARLGLMPEGATLPQAFPEVRTVGVRVFVGVVVGVCAMQQLSECVLGPDEKANSAHRLFCPHSLP